MLLPATKIWKLRGQLAVSFFPKSQALHTVVYMYGAACGVRVVQGLVKWCRNEDAHCLPLWAGSNPGPELSSQKRHVQYTYCIFLFCSYSWYTNTYIVHVPCSKLMSLSSLLLCGLLKLYCYNVAENKWNKFLYSSKLFEQKCSCTCLQGIACNMYLYNS